MSKIPSLQNNKETTIGLSLIVGIVLLLVINISVVVTSLISVYGHKPSVTPRPSIEATVFSDALKLISQ
jgi:hypothetical protein